LLLNFLQAKLEAEDEQLKLEGTRVWIHAAKADEEGVTAQSCEADVMPL
jgi:hypothetical protein